MQSSAVAVWWWQFQCKSQRRAPMYTVQTFKLRRHASEDQWPTMEDTVVEERVLDATFRPFIAECDAENTVTQT